ncbi:pyridoxamine 5'-phosphate oxidase family protein [Clostridium sp. YIM B02515]|uniref:Pyridoxamine 5'-phosphate oxidase family protein n=1 Tax=Clostridium rhizosphaerae TaxID=2803861 RepID=A0ABS1T793_9CLOT|nr:pyridoxamine 5'-phosphate oxidase family protein [Clostridium rhizosphaerae]MBL4934204.1 pyridoxamine 5'-phosphate oxidase family protein [Clostridium rhizosphaerae]
MDFLNEFNRIMEGTKNIALATSVDDIPNVRIVNFYYNPENRGVVYFASFKGSSKLLEFSNNNKTSFTTVPVDSSEHVRVINALVQKSNLTIYDLKEEFVKKHPDYEVTISQAGHMLEVYELHFKEANVILGIKQAAKITL